MLVRAGVPVLKNPDSVGADGATDGFLVRAPVPPDLTPWVTAFVHRDECVDGNVVRLLPELRASIQIFLADPYWIRERDTDAAWRKLPRIALWAPRYRWGYGFAARRIRVYAVALSPALLPGLTGIPVARQIDATLDLSQIAPSLAAAIDVRPAESFDAWRARAADLLRPLAIAAARRNGELSRAEDVLATSAADAVASAAVASGWSERQFRRIVVDAYGVTPKRVQRALRVDRLLRQLHERPWEPDRWGNQPIPFADQPHAIREFRALTGLTPMQYLRAKRAGDRTLRSVAAPEIEAPPG